MHWLAIILLNLVFTDAARYLQHLPLPHNMTVAGTAFQTAPAAQTTETKVPQSWDVRSIHWQVINPDGQKWAVLEGRSDAPGEAFTYAAFLPAGVHDFHSHSSDARVVILQGTLKVNFGEHQDLQNLTSFPTGTYLFVPANVKHTMAADVDTILIGTAVGPWHTSHHDAMSHDHAHQ